MQKQIKYKGMSTTPSDYDCPDGDLSVCMNLVNENGLIPTDKPSAIFSTEYDVVHIHKNKGYTNYILKNGLTLSLKDGADIVTVPSLREVTSIGNILIIMTDEDIRYALFKDGAYKYLGSEMPTPHIYFATEKYNDYMAGNVTPFNAEFSTINLPFVNSAQDATNVSDGEMSSTIKEMYASALKTVSDAVIGAINKKTASILESGKFTLPFFVRYALRMYDGTIIKHSAPILIDPGFANIVAVPQGSSYVPKTPISELPTYYISGFIRDFFLYYRIIGDSRFEDWRDIISSIDIFISKPIYSYDQSKNIQGIFSKEYALQCLSDQRLVDAIDNVYPESLYVTYNKVWLPYRKPSDYLEEIVNTSTFYKIASFNTEDIIRGYSESDNEAVNGDTLYDPDGNKLHILKPKLLSSLTSQEVMSDDFRTHSKLSAEGSYIYNSRLNIYNLGTKIKGYNPRVYNTYKRFATTNPPTYETHTNMQVSVKKEDGITANILSSTEETGVKYVCPFPVFYFFPEANAEKVIWQSGSLLNTLEKNLKTHPSLNGAYYLNENLQSESLTGVYKQLVESNNVIYSPNQIKLSEVNNPFVFKSVNTYNVGSGEIKNVSSASKALSEGQFGQFPLYAFTTDGVWALEVSSTGTYSSKQPATRDILSGEVAQIDGAVAFITKQGLMLLSGITSQCISTIIGEDVININLPSSIVTPGTIPFNEYIQDAFLSYDYIHRRLFVINPSNTYSYCFSMRYQTWSVINESYSGYLNSYPESLLKKGNLVLTYADNEIFSSQYLITRPIKLDSEELKTITQLIQRGVLTDVQQILYGSRDGVNYRVISSSSTKRLTAHGSPYKYFVLVVKTEMIKGQILEGLSTLFDIKFNNKLR